MKPRVHGSIWPLVSVAGGALFVLVIVPLMMQRGQSARMATVDPQVSIGDFAVDPTATRITTPVYRWPDSEVPRTAERLRDVTAVAVAAVTYVTEGAIKGRAPHDIGEIVAAIVEHQLIPAEWITNQRGVLQMPRGTIHLRYSPDNLRIEVVSVPNKRADGPAILIRVPDPENPNDGARYFESTHLDGIVYPAPFAPIAEIVTSGWQPRNYQQSQLPDDQRAQIEHWANSQPRHESY